MGPLLVRPSLRRRSLAFAHDDRQVRKGFENSPHAAAPARLKALEHERLPDMRLRHDELVDIEVMVVLRIGNRRFQALAHIARHALAGKFKLRKRRCYLLAANELREKIELLRADPQHARNSLRFVIGKRTFARLLAHARSPALRTTLARRSCGCSRAGRGRTCRALRLAVGGM